MKTAPFKMKGKSPMMKALIGKQGNLPEGLKAKILASPESPAKMKKAPTKMKKESSMKMMKKSPAKLDMGTIKKVVNTKIKDIPKKVKKVVRKTAKKVGNTTIKDAVKTLSPSIKAIDAMRTGFSGKISQTKKKVKKSNAKGKNVNVLATLEQNNDRNAYRSTPTKMKKSPAKMKKSPAKLAGLAKTGAKILSKAKKAYTKFKKGKPVSKSTETNPGGKISKKTVEYKKTTDRTFYNADGTINRKSSLPNK